MKIFDNAAFYKYPDMDIVNNDGIDEKPDVAIVNDLVDTVKPPIALVEPMVIDDIEVNLRLPPLLPSLPPLTSSQSPPSLPSPSSPVLSLEKPHESVFGIVESAKRHEDQAAFNVGQKETGTEIYLKTQESVDEERERIPLDDVETIKENSQTKISDDKQSIEDEVNIEVKDDDVPVRAIKTNSSRIESDPLPSDEVARLSQERTEDDWSESKEVSDYEQGALEGKDGVADVYAKHDDDVLRADSDEEAVDGVHEVREGGKGDRDEVDGGVLQGKEDVRSGDGDHNDVVLHIDSDEELGVDLERSDHVGATEGDGDHADSDEEINLGGLENQEGVEDGDGNHHDDLPHADSDGDLSAGVVHGKDNDEDHDEDVLHADSHEVGDGVLEGSGEVKDGYEDHDDDALLPDSEEAVGDGVSIGSE